MQNLTRNSYIYIIFYLNLNKIYMSGQNIYLDLKNKQQGGARIVASEVGSAAAKIIKELPRTTPIVSPSLFSASPSGVASLSASPSLSGSLSGSPSLSTFRNISTIPEQYRISVPPSPHTIPTPQSSFSKSLSTLSFTPEKNNVLEKKNYLDTPNNKDSNNLLIDNILKKTFPDNPSVNINASGTSNNKDSNNLLIDNILKKTFPDNPSVNINASGTSTYVGPKVLRQTTNSGIIFNNPLKDKNGLTDLEVAIESDNLRLVDFLLQSGENINTLDRNGNTLFRKAVQKGNLEIIKLFLKNGANINETNLTDDTALMESIYKGNIKMVKFLVDNKVNLDEQNEAGYTALIFAVKSGNLEIVKFLVDNKAKLNQQTLMLGETALMFAAKNGNFEIAEFLVNKGADLTITNVYNNTALDEANENKHKNIVLLLFGFLDSRYISEEERKYIIDNPEKYNINKTDSNGFTALTYYINKGNLKKVKILLDMGANVNQQYKNKNKHKPLTDSISKNVEITKLLLERGADINEINDKGDTSTILAVKYENKEVLELMVKMGADINKVNMNGYTALMYAIDNEMFKEADYLLDNGAIVNRNLDALMTAIESENLEITKLVLGNKTYKFNEELVNKDFVNEEFVNEETKFNETPLTYAIMLGKYKTIKLLLDNKANINQETKNGTTPLNNASERGDVKIIKLLLKRGADINQENKNNKTPLIMAIKSRDVEVIKLLLDNKANINQETKNGTTPLNNAIDVTLTDLTRIKYVDNVKVETEHIEVIKLLLERGADTNITNKSGRTQYQELEFFDENNPTKESHPDFYNKSIKPKILIIKNLIRDAESKAKNVATPADKRKYLKYKAKYLQLKNQ